MNGKSKCKILKDIRRQIAAQNDITYVTSECKFQGNCTGTCPKCEAEVRYLEEELRKRQQSGKAIAVAGIAAAMLLTAGCQTASDNSTTTQAPSYSESVTLQGDISVSTDPTEGILMGAPETLPDEPLMGEEIPDPTEDTIMGDMLPPEENPEPDMGDIVPPEEGWEMGEIIED